MQALDKDEFVHGIALFVADQVRSATEPLLKMIEGQQKMIEEFQETNLTMLRQTHASALEHFEQKISALPTPKDGKDGAPGKDADLEHVRELIKEERKLFIHDAEHRFAEMKEEMMPWDEMNEQLSAGIQMLSDQLDKKIEALPKAKDGRDGKDAEPVDVDDVVSRVAALVPAGKDGAPGKDGRDGKDGVDGAAGADGKDGADGAPGKDAEPVILDDVIQALWDHDVVAKVLALVPLPKDGKDGRDGLDGVNFYREDGKLHVVMSNGAIKSLGVVDGKDGSPGKDGADGKDGVNGADGKDGRDGFGFEDLRVDVIDGKTWLVFSRGEETKSFLIPIFSDRGVWRAGKYQALDCATLDGSLFIAQRDTEAMPGTSADWRLAVKRGRDGKDGAPGKKGDRGEKGNPGRDGRDLTQLGPDGKKW